VSLSDAELQGIAAQVFNMAKRDLERDDFNFLVAAYHRESLPPLYRMRQVEALVVARLGEDWLNHGETKDIGFSVLRIAVAVAPPDAVAVVSVVNWFALTPKFQELTPAAQEALLNGGHDKHHRAVEEGTMSVCDALSAVVQTPQRVCTYTDTIGRKGPRRSPQVLFSPQSELDGRLKLYGSLENAFTTKTGRKT
jgi:hypothetical protein